MRRFLLVLAAAVALCSVAAVSPAPADAGDNAAVAVNVRDGSSTFRLAFKITRVNRDEVDSSNAAVAVASCTDCETVAVAIQAVLIFSDASDVRPTNLAFAFNLECDRCYTLATAYQFVATTGIVHFTPEGNQRIAAIRQQLQELRHSDLSIDEIQVRVDVLAAELLNIMRTELVTPGFEASGTRTDPEGAAAVETTPPEATASSADAPTAPAEAEETSAEQTVDSPTETSPTDTAAQDSTTLDTDSSSTSTEPVSEPTTEAPAESATP